MTTAGFEPPDGDPALIRAGATMLHGLTDDLSGDDSTVAEGVKAAVGGWTGTRNDTFVRASGGVQAQLRTTWPGARRVAAALDTYATVLDSVRSQIADLDAQATRILGRAEDAASDERLRTRGSSAQATDAAGPGSGEVQVEPLRAEVRGLRTRLDQSISGVLAEIGAATDTVLPAGAGLSPDQIRSAVAAAHGSTGLPAAGTPRSDAQLQAAVAAAAGNVPRDAVGADGSLDTTALGAAPAVPPAQTHPADVKTWWDGLSRPQQEALAASGQAAIGNLDGIPATVRDRVNRSRLDPEIAKWEKEVAALGPAPAPTSYPMEDTVVTNEMEIRMWHDRHDPLQAKLDGTRQLKQRLAEPHQPPLYLLGLENGQSRYGQAIVSSGNPDTADRIATFVPGTGTDLPGIASNMDRADVMQQATDSPETSASITWLGYDPPFVGSGRGVFEVTSKSWAANGAAALDRFQAGLRTTHTGERSRNTVIGHSYGTTTIGWAASHGNTLDADNLVFIASPGVTVETVDELRLTSGPARGRVYATASPADPIPDVGDTALGGSPTDDRGLYNDGTGFGASIFASDPTGGHSDYWSNANKDLAMRSVGLIINGHGDDAPPPPPPSGPPFPENEGGGF